MSDILAFFPLPLAVIPGQTFPLHIFEQRYKDLYSQCKEGQEFAISMLTENGLAVMGCTVRITKTLEIRDDGSIDILVEGIRRYQLNSVIKEKSFDQAEVSFVEDDGKTTLPAEKIDLFKSLHKQISSLTGLTQSEITCAEFISYKSAALIGLDDFQRQTLLELRAENDRISWLTELYQAILDAVKNEGTLKRDLTLSEGQDPGLVNIH